MNHGIMIHLIFSSPLYNAYWSDGRFADGKDGDNPIAEHHLGGSMKKQNWQRGW